jgi:hypothetical protein
VRVGDVNVGGIWWARFGLRRRITWMLGCLRERERERSLLGRGGEGLVVGTS